VYAKRFLILVHVFVLSEVGQGYLAELKFLPVGSMNTDYESRKQFIISCRLSLRTETFVENNR
jgi:hypothetical protein